MTLAAGTRLGPYEILAPIGAGGMGEVYRARDTRLERTVAIKVLPSHLSENTELRRRFEREARTISALSHPHICALHDVGREDGTDYLVMEYVEGETLSDRLVKGPLPTEQVLRYGIEIADALDKAHRQGIVHRDLKPGNVMLTRSGVKLLDFGLAKVRELEEAPAGLSVSLLATRTSADRSPLTEKGTILGTFQYMAPEQLEGKEADARSDLFAFGAVLYEMATGQKAFTGKTQALLIGAILHTEPPAISKVQPLAPPALDRVVKTCLAKDPEDRWQTAHDVMLQLKAIAEGGSQAAVVAPTVAPRRNRERALWVSNALTAAAAIALGALFLSGRSEPPRLVHSSIVAPDKATFVSFSGPPLISPDGRLLAFIAAPRDAKPLLWVRPLDSPAARPLPGTEGATYPFWSPDSRYLAFFADGRLKKVDSRSGGVESITAAPVGRGGSWSRGGVILFAPSPTDPLFRVSASGGAPTPVTRLDAGRGETSHRFPFFLPDGRHFLYSVHVSSGPEWNRAYVGSLDSKENQLLLSASTNVVYAPPGFLLFVRERSLRAQPFDAKSLRLIGEAFAVAEDVQYNFAMALGQFSASDSRTLAYTGGGAAHLSRLLWVDPTGRELGAVGGPGLYWDPRLSHDGRRLAFGLEDSVGNTDIWIHELERGVSSRFTFDSEAEVAPVWSPDGSRVVFTSYRGSGKLSQKISTGAGSTETLFVSAHRKIASDWSADGRFLSFHTLRPETGWDVAMLSLRERKVSTLIQTEFAESMPVFSPNGRWVAYVSVESGRAEVYVQPFPGPGGKWQASSAGGVMPVWRRDGRVLFYLSVDEKMMAVDVRAEDTFEVGTPRALFPARLRSFPGLQRRQYDVSPDGNRILLNAMLEEQLPVPITLVQNWTAKAPR